MAEGSRTLTREQLRRHEACPRYLRRFEQEFGDSVEVTPERARARAADFDFAWAGRLLSLGSEGRFRRRLAAMAREHEALKGEALRARWLQGSAWFEFEKALCRLHRERVAALWAEAYVADGRRAPAPRRAWGALVRALLNI